jgi:putative ABC transport system permease protein
MNREQLNHLVGEKEDYYNAYLSEDSLDIDDRYIYSKTTSSEVIDSVKSILDNKKEMKAALTAVSIIVFIIVMYLILKMLIDKSTFSISLVKVFGYTNKELNKIYLGSSFYTVVISMIISLPISTFIFNKIYPQIVAHVQSYMFVKIKLVSYLIMFVISIVTYFISKEILKKHLYSVKLSEILKN